MKCIHCYRDIEDGLKFCTKCGFQQPEDREAYEREHPELADAIPEDEVFQKIEQVKVEKSDAMSYDELVQLLSADPHCDDILMMVNEGLVFFSITPEQEPAWYAKCANLINDKIGFYPFFMQCLNEGYEKARSLFYNQARSNWTVAPTVSSKNVQVANNDASYIQPSIPAPTPVMPVAQPQPVVPINNTYTPAYTTPAPTATKNCPYCNNIIPAGAEMCPYCHAALNFSNNQSYDTPAAKPENKKSKIWILPVAIFGVLILGLIIYAFVPKGPTGDPEKDAKQVGEEVLKLMKRDIDSMEDYKQFEADFKDIQEKYEDYYREKDELSEFRKALNNLDDDPEFKEKMEEAQKEFSEKLKDVYNEMNI